LPFALLRSSNEGIQKGKTLRKFRVAFDMDRSISKKRRPKGCRRAGPSPPQTTRPIPNPVQDRAIDRAWRPPPDLVPAAVDSAFGNAQIPRLSIA
jgi:hypothetical protein